MNNEQIAKIKEIGMYDFIAQDGWKLSKEQLIAIAKELDYKLNEVMNKGTYNLAIDEILENVRENEE